MRRLRMDTNEMKQVIADTIETLNTNKNVTITMASLLKLPRPEVALRPRITISEMASKKMKALVDNIDKEIAWHGVVTRTASDAFLIEDIIVYPQRASGVTVESDDDLYAIWLDELDDEVFNSIRMQGHSHVNMPVSPSPTDETFYETLTQHIQDYYIFIILNKSNKMWVNLYDIIGNRLYETEDLLINIQGETYTEWADEQIEEHVDIAIPHAKQKFATLGSHMSVEEYLDYYERRRAQY